VSFWPPFSCKSKTSQDVLCVSGFGGSWQQVVSFKRSLHITDEEAQFVTQPESFNAGWGLELIGIQAVTLPTLNTPNDPGALYI
jgi:hypothetical protein